MKAFLKKLTSRKFIAAMIGTIVGIAMVFGVDAGGITDAAEAVTAVAKIVGGAATAITSIATYIHTEGDVDAVSAVPAITSVVDDSEEESEAK